MLANLCRCSDVRRPQECAESAKGLVVLVCKCVVWGRERQGAEEYTSGSDPRVLNYATEEKQTVPILRRHTVAG